MTTLDFADLADDFAHDLSVAEVAKLFGVTPQTVMGWCRKHGFGYKVPHARAWRIPRDRLEQIRRAREAAVRA
jgi:transposase-like protein